MPRVTLVLVSSRGFRPRGEQGERSRVPSLSAAVCDLRETTVSMVLNLECRSNHTCLGRKELFPVRSVPRKRSQGHLSGASRYSVSFMRMARVDRNISVQTAPAFNYDVLHLIFLSFTLNCLIS